MSKFRNEPQSRPAPLILPRKPVVVRPLTPLELHLEKLLRHVESDPEVKRRKRP